MNRRDVLLAGAAIPLPWAQEARADVAEPESRDDDYMVMTVVGKRSDVERFNRSIPEGPNDSLRFGYEFLSGEPDRDSPLVEGIRYAFLNCAQAHVNALSSSIDHRVLFGKYAVLDESIPAWRRHSMARVAAKADGREIL